MASPPGWLAQKRQNLIDPVQDYNLGRRTKIGIACGVDNSRLIESELPSRIFGVGYDQMECLDIQELALQPPFSFGRGSAGVIEMGSARSGGLADLAAVCAWLCRSKSRKTRGP